VSECTEHMTGVVSACSVFSLPLLMFGSSSETPYLGPSLRDKWRGESVAAYPTVDWTGCTRHTSLTGIIILMKCGCDSWQPEFDSRQIFFSLPLLCADRLWGPHNPLAAPPLFIYLFYFTTFPVAQIIQRRMTGWKRKWSWPTMFGETEENHENTRSG
jgi:hypothetical protein